MADIRQVAARAGVSAGTVSNVLNRPASVAPATRARVERAIDELGYVRNEPARQLRAGASRTLALVVIDVTNPFYADIITGAEQVAEADGALVIVCNSAGSPRREERHLAQLAEQRVLGVLLTPVLSEPHPGLEELARRGIPYVLVDRVALDATAPSVAVDDTHGGRLVGRHLADAGHEWIAVISGPLSLPQMTDRLSGVRGAVTGSRWSVDRLAGDEMSVSAGSAAAARLFETWPDPTDRPTAVFCTNDLLALGVLNECLRRGVSVPDDLAIVGYDDIEFAATAAVPLTSVRQPREQLGRTAVELLHQLVRGGPPPDPRHVIFTPELVARESTRRHA